MYILTAKLDKATIFDVSSLQHEITLYPGSTIYKALITGSIKAINSCFLPALAPTSDEGMCRHPPISPPPLCDSQYIVYSISSQILLLRRTTNVQTATKCTEIIKCRSKLKKAGVRLNVRVQIKSTGML